MKMMKTKHFRRLVVFLAMIAPAVYLFGSLFSGLTGAHGTQVFADSVTQSVNVDFSLSSGDIDTETGAVISSDGLYVISDSLYIPDGASSVSLVSPSSATGFFAIRVYQYSESAYLSTSFVNSFPVSFSIVDGASYIRFRFRFDQGNPLNATVNFEGALHFDDSVGYSDYVFGQFFDKDNFLVDWGRDAISETPHGFAPFGAFWRYLDVNVLHLSDLQIGLMGYGYLYYAAHVLLFDIGFVIVTFFLDFIQRIFEKFTGGE